MTMLKEEIKENTIEDNKNLIRNSKFFNPKFYKRFNPNLKNKNLSDEELLDYYVKHNQEELIPPSRFFDIKWYLSHNSDVKDKQIEPLIHFLKFGRDEERLYRPTQLNFDMLDLPDKTKIYEEYTTIFHSDLFDIDYYLNNNGEFSLEGYDPILHYIIIGASRGYNPSQEFNTNKYIENTSFNKVLVNPLYHYLKYGQKVSSDKMINILLDNSRGIMDIKRIQHGTIDDIFDHLERKISIIIPIFNAYEETCRCIRSVLLNTHLNYELILINDCSTDERIIPLLESLKDIPGIHVINNKENMGFVANVNLGIKESGNDDIVLLNSDTIVTPRWLTRLVVAAYYKPSAATVTPLSNNSDISVERLGRSDDQLFINKNAYQLSKLDFNSYHIAPTGNGFCLYIKRGALNKVGSFDPIFKRGYGEETDFTSRAREAGWINIRSFDTFIYHQRHASFTKEKTDKLKAENKKINMKRHPDVFRLWDEFIKDKKIQNAIQQTSQIDFYANGERILYVTQKDKNGNLQVNDEFYKIADKYDTYIMTVDDEEIELFLYDGIFNFVKIYEHTLIGYDDDEFIRVFFRFMVIPRFDLIYLTNKDYDNNILSHMNEDLMKASKLLEIPVVYEDTSINMLCEIDEKLNPIKTFDETIEDMKTHTNDTIFYRVVDDDESQLEIPENVNENYDYVLFSNDETIKSDFWDIIIINDEDMKTYSKTQKIPQKYLHQYKYQIHDTNIKDQILKTESKLNNNPYTKSVMQKILTKLDEPTTIILQADTNYENLKTCLDSLFENTNMPYDLIIIQEDKTNKHITSLIEKYMQKHENIHIIINDKKQSFIKTINQIIKTLKNDMVILKSSTILTPNWLSKLKSTAYTDDTIATVTPISNNASVFSVPEIYEENKINSNLSINDVVTIIEKQNYKPIKTPTLNHFCMFIKKDAIDTVGMFDVKYNYNYSEVDYAIRLMDAGWINVVDPTVYLYNNKTTPLNDDELKLEYEDSIYLNYKYPDHKQQLEEFINNQSYQNLRSMIDDELNSTNAVENAQQNVLLVVDDINNLKIPNTESVIIYILSKDNILYKITSLNMEYKEIIELNCSDDLELTYFNILKQLHIKNIYLKDNNLQIKELAEKMKIDIQ